MRTKSFLCLLLLSLVIGCSEAETTNVTDGLPQSEIDKYNAMVEADEAQKAADGDKVD